MPARDSLHDVFHELRDPVVAEGLGLALATNLGGVTQAVDLYLVLAIAAGHDDQQAPSTGPADGPGGARGTQLLERRTQCSCCGLAPVGSMVARNLTEEWAWRAHSVAA